MDALFREPLLLLATLETMAIRQDEDIARLTQVLKTIGQIQEFAKLNQFEAGRSFETDFGSLNVYECSSYSPVQSQLLNVRQWNDMLALCEFSLSDKWTLLYRGSEHGFDAEDFYSRCEFKANTLTIIKPDETPHIFGGYTSVEWVSSLYKHREDPTAFIFSLVNNDNKPIKMRVTDPMYAIYCEPSYGPTFGWNDISIAENPRTSKDSCSNLGFYYSHPMYEKETPQAQSFLAGAFKFRVSEIEVFARSQSEPMK